MRRSWRFRRGAEYIVIVRAYEAPPDTEASTLPPAFASLCLEDALRRRAEWGILLSLHEEMTGSRPDPVNAAQMSSIVARLQHALELGTLVAHRLAPPRFLAGSLPGTTVKSTGFEPEELPLSEALETTWVEIELVGEDDPPSPIPDVRYRLVLPDASIREGWLDRNGRARIEGIPRGTCRVSFPDLDQAAWSALR